ncbi:MAG: bifunctional 4-hydroxy-2-oxoglutarate aldolase/2-dehydro-3-deoxy-phosphogluconate aldolase [Eubacteriales bacterium]|nr:bifunctional 4-hydroxy-2-oxoglutarate aldolase/2-dehydro-3-deoxy-phosphogluconate aldolase [Eubacteriales bacterium]
MTTMDWIYEYKIIAIVRGLALEPMQALAEALYRGEIHLMEVTFNQAKPETWQDTAACIRMLRERFQNRILPGAGTVMTLEQLSMAADAGAQYIISPNVDVEIIRETRRRGLVSLPGTFTPSEITLAYQAGANAVKIFPVGNLGAAYVKGIRAPLSQIPMLAVGGVNEKNAAEFIAAGCLGIGVGSNLVNKDWIAAGEWDKITALAAEYRKVVG